MAKMICIQRVRQTELILLTAKGLEKFKFALWCKDGEIVNEDGAARVKPKHTLKVQIDLISGDRTVLDAYPKPF